MRKWLLIAASAGAASLLFASPAFATCPITNNLSNGNPADAGQVMTNFTDLANCTGNAPTLNGDVVINTRNVAQSSALQINTPGVLQQAAILINQNGAPQWQFGKDQSNSFFIWDANASRYDLNIASNGNMYLMPSGGYVGIGTTAPASTLDVAGDINTAANHSYKIGGTQVLYQSHTNNSLALGFGAGGSWVGSATAYLSNVAIGSSAMLATITGSAAIFNTAVGTQAMQSLTTGYYNTALGGDALANNPSGNSNTAIGLNALYLSTAGSENVAVGTSALTSNSGSDNVAVGMSAANGSASYSSQGITAVGALAGSGAATGSNYNTFFGYKSGENITSGSRNVLIGPATIFPSYAQVTTGSGNIAIGNDVAVASATASNQLVIGNLIYGTNLSGTGSTVSAGGIGIGTPSPAARLAIKGGGTTTGQTFQTLNSSGTALVTMLDNGNVGIGASSPNFTFQVSGTGTYTSYAGTGGINISNAAAPAEELYFGVDSTLGTNGSGYIQSAKSGTAFTNLLLEPNTGSVGINTTVPNALLSLGSTLTTIKVATYDGGAAALYGMGANSGKLTFGANIAATGTPQMVLTSAGLVGIGNIAPAVALDVVGSIKQTGCTTAGTLSVLASGQIVCTSDARLKNVLGDYSGGMEQLASVTPKLFRYKPTKADPSETFVHAGFIAQNVRAAIPQAVAIQHDGYYSLDTTAILAASVNAIKSLKATNDAERAHIALQDTEIAMLKSRLARLELKSGTRTAMK